MTLGTDVYPEPPAVTVKPVTAPPLIVAVAVAPEPPPPLIVTTGAELYPRPPYCSVIEPSAPEDSRATPAAVPGVAPGSRKSVDRNAALACALVRESNAKSSASPPPAAPEPVKGLRPRVTATTWFGPRTWQRP